MLFQKEDKEDFADLAKHGIVDVVGDDKGGRKIVVISACRFPSNKIFNNQRFLRLFYNLFVLLEVTSTCRYLMATLDRYVDMDYSLVYFHHDISSKTKLPLSWLWGLYKVIIIHVCQSVLNSIEGPRLAI